ncbi:MAG: alkaline phosphatase family protein, partial [Candidatus Bipolaricaulia bacterium]
SKRLKNNSEFLFLMHFFSTDLVQHFLWNRVTDEWDPRLEVFRVVDQVIGKILELAPENSSFIVVSDHGFGPVERIFNVNNWLRKEGYLEIEDSSKAWLKRGLSRLGLNQRSLKSLGEKVYPIAKSLGLAPKNSIAASSHPLLKSCFLSARDVNWEKTVAYSKSDIGHVRLNLSQREKEGWIDRKEVPTFQEEIQKKLESVKIPDTGKKLADWVKPKEEIYYGPYLKDAPDLLFNPLTQKSVGFGAAMFISDELFVDPFKPGDHRRNGILMASGPTVHPGKRDASIIDIAPTLLNLFNYPIPEQMDGEVIREIAPDEPTYHRPADFYRSRKVEAEFDDSRKKLENLGYL